MRILLAGTELAGHSSGLQKGLESLGHDVVLATPPNYFGYIGAYGVHPLVRLHHIINRKSKEKQFPALLLRLPYKLLNLVCKLVLVLWASLRFDAIIFGSNKTFTNCGWELLVYKLARPKVAVTFQGSDARPGYIDASLFPQGERLDVERMHKYAKRSAKRIQKAEKYADAIFAYPAISHFFSKPFFYGPFGNPVQPPQDSSATQAKTAGPGVNVVHCPSSPASKGTNDIRAMIELLKAEGCDVMLTELSNVPNAEVHRVVANADLLIDSLWNDCPHGTFPAEGAYYGKPVIIGSYFASEQPLFYINNKYVAPFIFCRPDEVLSWLRRLIKDHELRRDISLRSTHYFHQHGSLNSIAAKYLKCIFGDAKPEWIVDPRKITYFRGYGAPEPHIKIMVREYLARFGRSALCLEHRPDLEAGFVNFANN